MQKSIAIFLFIISILPNISLGQTIIDIEKNRIVLPNRWGITPVGTHIGLGDLPLNIAVSKSKKLIAITNNGQGEQSIQLIDTKKEKMLDSFIIDKCWLGLEFAYNDKSLFASGGNDNIVIEFDVSHKTLKVKDTITLGEKWPTLISLPD
ncbi:MAG: hypothetical protein R2771_15080 [Saprospiraceae bacterium]